MIESLDLRKINDPNIVNLYININRNCYPGKTQINKKHCHTSQWRKKKRKRKARRKKDSKLIMTHR